MRARRLGVLFVTFLLPACGTWAGGGDGTTHRIPVHVDNDLTARSDVTVRLHFSTGASRVLGGTPPGTERDFEYRASALSGSYYLTARTSDGRVIRSRSFTLFPGVGVVWTLRRNELQVVNAPPPEGYRPDGAGGGISGSAPGVGAA